MAEIRAAATSRSFVVHAYNTGPLSSGDVVRENEAIRINQPFYFRKVGTALPLFMFADFPSGVPMKINEEYLNCGSISLGIIPIPLSLMGKPQLVGFNMSYTWF